MHFCNISSKAMLNTSKQLQIKVCHVSDVKLTLKYYVWDN